MARTPIPAGEYTAVKTTTLDTLFMPEGGNARVFTGDASGIATSVGVIVKEGVGIIFPSGLIVNFTTDVNGVDVQDIDFGV